MPGMKDYVSIMTDTGKREHVQKRLILCSLKELYEHFKTLHPNVKVGFTMFASRRPKHCVWQEVVGHILSVFVLCTKTLN